MSMKNLILVLIGGLLFLVGIAGFIANYLQDANVCVIGIGIIGLALVWVGIRNERYAKSKVDVPALISKLAHKDVAKRYDAAQALGVLNDARAIEPLLLLLEDENSNVQHAAANALSHIDSLNAEQTRVLKEWFDSLVSSLITELDNPFYPVEIPHQRISSRSLPKSSPVDPVNHKTRDALVAIGLPAVKQLKAALHHPNLNVRLLAISALGRISDPSSVNSLIDVIQNSRSTERAWAVNALGNVGRSSVSEMLISFLNDPDTVVREAAVLALEKFGDSRALPELERVAQSDKALVDRFLSVGDMANTAIKKIRKRARKDSKINK
jgi:HEAT repeat protein